MIIETVIIEFNEMTYYATLILCLMSFAMTACAEKQDEKYFLNNPGELQNALAKCPSQPPTNISCATLTSMAKDLQRAVMIMQQNPQELGMKVIELQNIISAKQLASSSREQQLLNRYMAVVRMFESPGR